MAKLHAEDASAEEIIEAIMNVRWRCRRGRTDRHYEQNHLLLNDLLDAWEIAVAREAAESGRTPFAGV